MQNEYRTRHLVAREPFFYDGRILGIGERFSATPQHAMILEGLSKAAADDDEPTPAAPAEEEDNSRTVTAVDEDISEVDDSSDTQATRDEKNRKRRERQQRRVLHTSTAKAD
jgi:hypothetical protein